MTLPSFLVAGVARAGTTSLCAYLAQHPDVYLPFQKECSYWLYADDTANGRARPHFPGPGDDAYARGIVTSRDAYEAMFDGAGSATAIGEASVYYWLEPAALERARDVCGDLRVVLVLRDPAARAFSAYALLVRESREPEHRFAKALAMEDARRRQGWEWAWAYRHSGFYAERIAVLQQRFGDRLLVLRHDELARDSIATTQRVYSFLGVDDGFVPDVSMRLNRGGVPYNRTFQRMLTGGGPVRRWVAPVVPDRVKHRLFDVGVRVNTRPLQLDDADRDALVAAYAADVERLEALLGWDLREWRTPRLDTDPLEAARR